MLNNIKGWAEKHSGKHPLIHYLNDWGHVVKNTVTFSHKTNDAQAYNPFFIVGSGRSGNTLLRTMLTKKDDIVIPPESFVLGEAIRKFKMYRHMEWPDLCGVFCAVFERHHGFPRWGIDLREFYKEAIQFEPKHRNLEYLVHAFYSFYGSQKKPEATRWGDKTPINTFSLKLINNVFKDSQFVHIIRDGRDVVNSYVKAGLYEDVQGAAERWNRSIHIAREFGEKVGPDRYHEVYYEDLVREPEREIKAICTFLNIDYTPEMLDNTKGVQDLGDTYLSHHTNLHVPINENSIGKWRNELSAEQRASVQYHCQELLNKLGYPS
ncbi:sulfotransferase [Thalassobacillus sp. CUG 92003]|uniref:sulfotransferase n=1 Tax=Thalassobacillus sp. CUG 92003 TaxID=2736641 RepID=UPI0015E6A065|nr:sulfotransferase [Thalassobacillus sp. CUG 92003]